MNNTKQLSFATFSKEKTSASIENAFKPFMTEDAAKKLAPAGFSQRNECVNSMIGSKAPKISQYSGSESSDFRTAAGVAQFNDGFNYVVQAAEQIGVAHNVAFYCVYRDYSVLHMLLLFERCKMFRSVVA